VGFKRGADGRVALLSDGEEFAVKADMQAPGYLLLRCASVVVWQWVGGGWWVRRLDGSAALGY